MKRRSAQRGQAARTMNAGAGNPQAKSRLAIFALILTVVTLSYIGYHSFPGTQGGRGGRSQVGGPPKTLRMPSQQPASKENSLTVTPPAPVVLPEVASAFSTEVVQQELLTSVEQVILRFPDDASVLYIGAMTYAELLQTSRAMELYEASLALDGTRLEVAVGYARMLEQLGDWEKAKSVLIAADGQGADSSELLALLGDVLGRSGELESSAEVLQRGVELFPADGALRLGLAQSQLQLNEFKSAEENARLAIELGEDRRAAYLAQSTALLKLGRREEALEVRRKIPSVESHVVEADTRYYDSFREFASHTYSLLGMAFASHGELAQAEESLLRAVALQPQSESGLLALADLYRRSARVENALVVLQRLTTLQPENLVNFTNAANLSLQLGEVERAQQYLKQAIQHDSSGNAHYIMAQFLLGVGEFQSAAEHAEVAASRLQDIDSYGVWIQAANASGDRATAIAILMKARELFPKDARLARLLN